MKYTNKRAFEKHLDGAHPNHYADLYLVISKESAERKEAVDILTGHLLRGEENPGLCIKSFEAERLTADALATELHGLSFLSNRRIVVIHQGEKLTKPLQGVLEAYFARPNPSTASLSQLQRSTRIQIFIKKRKNAESSWISPRKNLGKKRKR